MSSCDWFTEDIVAELAAAGRRKNSKDSSSTSSTYSQHKSSEPSFNAKRKRQVSYGAQAQIFSTNFAATASDPGLRVEKLVPYNRSYYTGSPKSQASSNAPPAAAAAGKTAGKPSGGSVTTPNSKEGAPWGANKAWATSIGSSSRSLCSKSRSSGSWSGPPRKHFKLPGDSDQKSTTSSVLKEQEKLSLLDKLRTYHGSNDNGEETFDDDEDDGDVSGEDIFSEDECDSPQGNGGNFKMKMRYAKNNIAEIKSRHEGSLSILAAQDAYGSFVSRGGGKVGRVLNHGAVGSIQDSKSVCSSTYLGQVHPMLAAQNAYVASAASSASVSASVARGTGSHRQSSEPIENMRAIAERDLNTVTSRYGRVHHPVIDAQSMMAAETAYAAASVASATRGGSHRRSTDPVIDAQSMMAAETAYAAASVASSTREGSHRRRPDPVIDAQSMMAAKTAYAAASVASSTRGGSHRRSSEPIRQDSKPAALPDPFQANTSSHGRMAERVGSNPPRSPATRNQNAREMFADLEAQIMMQDELDGTGHTASTAASHSTIDRPRPGSASIMNASQPPSYGGSLTHSSMNLPPRCNGRQLHENVGSNTNSMQAVSQQGQSGSSNSSVQSTSRESQGFNRRDRNIERPLREPSREVIASLEADIMRMEEEEETTERTFPVNHRNEPPLAIRQPAGMNQRDALNIMMAQQQHRNHGSVLPHHGPVGNLTLVDQISHMAIDPLQFEYDAVNSAKSVNSFATYDGKHTNVFATRVQTQEQELACHELNNAVTDLYGAPVGSILRTCPMVTRLIRADDETGNVQLHYAVRNGNVKAIRRIVRADPGCALIRNRQGYCPLHYAVHIGNFAAVQLLVSMIPASAEVQCNEGCLALHEAVSSAAHLPDAPQITAALINAFPAAIKITNDEGLLPLHLAAMSGFSAGIRTIFAYSFTTVYARENTEEMLPLDFSVDGYTTAREERMDTAEESSDDEISEKSSSTSEKELEFSQCIDIFLMSALYDRPVFAQARRDRPGIFLPIHGAAAAQPSLQSWKTIVSMYGKDYDNEVDVRGRTALHVIASSKLYYLETVTAMIQDILQLDPSSATSYDDSGLIPLHTALIHLQKYPVIEHLLESNLSTITMVVDEDCDFVQYRGMLPFQLAAACGCGLDVVNLLLRAHPVAVAGALLN